jgi:type I restriction enzyme S subunit
LVTGSELKTKEQQICRSGDFLVAEIDAKVGGYGIVPDELDGAIVSSHYFLFEVNRDQLDRNFLGYFIKTPDFFDQVSARGTTNYAAIRPSHVLEYQIPLPPMEEQRRIVAKIDELANKTEKARALCREVAQEMEGLLSRVAARSFAGPHDCEMKTGQDVCSVITKGTTPKTYGFGFENFGIPFLRAEEVQDGRILWEKSPFYISAETDKFMSRSRIQRGDVLVTIAGTIGRCGVVGPEAPPLNCNQAVAVMRPSAEIDSEFLCWVLRSESLQEQIRGRTVTTAVSNISLTTLSTLRIPVSPLPEQRRIVAELDALQAKEDALKRLQAETAAELDALLPSILDKAFKGEL